MDLQKQLRSVSRNLSDAVGRLNQLVPAGKLVPAELDAAYAACEQALAEMPALREAVDAYVAIQRSEAA